MPKRYSPFDKSDKTVKGRACHSGNGDFGPHHVEPELADFRGNAKAHADDRRAEELRHDGPDKRQSRVDLERIENEGHGKRKPELDKGAPIARAIGAHEVALKTIRRIKPG